jgi:hypothetical protein
VTLPPARTMARGGGVARGSVVVFWRVVCCRLRVGWVSAWTRHTGALVGARVVCRVRPCDWRVTVGWVSSRVMASVQ